jgi:DNA-binding beta-propeller fold protein YncE
VLALLVAICLAAGCGGKFDKPLELDKSITMGEYKHQPYAGFENSAHLSITQGNLYVTYPSTGEVRAFFSIATPIPPNLVKAFTGLHRPTVIGAGHRRIAVLDEFEGLTVRIFGLSGGAPILSFTDPGWVSVSALAVDDSGNVYVADAARNFVRAYRPDGRPRFEVDLADSGFGIGHVMAPTGLDLDGETLLISEGHAEKMQVQRVRLDRPQAGIPFSATNPYLGTFTDADGNEVVFVRPVGVASGKDGSIFVLDQGLGKIFQFDAQGNSLAVVNSESSGGPPDVSDAASLDTYNPPDSKMGIYILDSVKGVVHRWEPK